MCGKHAKIQKSGTVRTGNQGIRGHLNMGNATNEPWKIGLLFSNSGCTSEIEATQLQGTLLAVEQINQAGGIHGRPLRPIYYDPGSEACAFGNFAKKLMIEDDVNIIFGCYTSSSRKAVLPVIERLNGLLWYPTLYEGFEYSPNIVYTGAAPNQNIIALEEYLTSTVGERMYLIGSDYIYARSTNRTMKQLLNAKGGQVVGETYLPLRANRADFKPVLREIKALQPDVIFSTVVGTSTIYLYQSYFDMGFNPATMPIASLTTTEAEIKAMGKDVGAGHVTAAPYFQSVCTDENIAFVNDWKKKYGDDQPTNMCAESAFFQVHVFAEALRQAGTMDTEVIKDSIFGSSFHAPQGKIAVDDSSRHTDLWTRLGRANSEGQFEVFYESSASVKPDPYMLYCGDCYSTHGGRK